MSQKLEREKVKGDVKPLGKLDVPIPENETSQPNTLLTMIRVLDSLPEEKEEYERLTRLACAACNAPVAFITFIDRERQWAKKTSGGEQPKKSHEESFCAHVLECDGVFTVSDTAKDPMFSDHPYVTGEKGFSLDDGESLQVRSYAGAPIRMENGDVLGTICVFDSKPRNFTEQEKRVLSDLSQTVYDDLRNRSRIEQLKCTDDLHENREPDYLRNLLDSIPIALCAINREGVIQFTNEKWKNFSENNAIAGFGRSGPGENYFDVCNSALEEGQFDNDMFLKGIREVLDGDRHVFSMEYSSTTGVRWFKIYVQSFSGNTGEAIISHIEVTARKKAKERIEEMNKKLQEANRELEKRTRIDELTNIPNRRAFDNQLTNALENWNWLDHSLSLLMIDIDRFKPYNDTLGHTRGDACLQKIAEELQLQKNRETDLIARYGGDEFAAILPGAGSSGAKKRAEKFCKEIRNLEITHPKDDTDVVTISTGVETLAVSDNNTDPESFVDRADQALYEAKHQGGDCVVSYGELE